jgi:hypothetical protein
VKATLLVVFACAALIVPASALADDFYVNVATGNDGNDCTTPSTPCQTILAAAGKTVDAAGGPDTVFVAPGTYPGGINLDSTDYGGLTITGSGPGTNPVNDTIISQSGAGSGMSIGGPTAAVDGVTIKNLRVTVTPAAPLGDTAISNFGTNTRIQEAALAIENADSTGYTFNSGRGPVTFDRVAATSASTNRAAVLLSDFDVTIGDSTLTSGGASVIGQTASSTTARTTRISRSSILGTGSGGYAVALNWVDLVLDSSLVVGGDAAVLLGTSGGAVHHATLRNDTIDGVNYATYASSTGSGSEEDIDIDSSILLDPQRSLHSDGDGSLTSVTCAWSDVPGQLQSASGGDGTIDCNSTAGNGAHNVFTPVAGDLFLDYSLGDYRLKASSPAIDSGSTAALAGDESTLDREGNPRVRDGNYDCVAQRDRGAYEFDGTGTAVPDPRITAPSSALIGTPVSLAGDADDEQPVATLNFHWTFSDGGSANTRNTSHTFSVLGAQQANLDVTDLCGNVGHAVKAISVLGTPAITPPPGDGPGQTVPDTAGASVSGASMTNRVFAVGNLARRVPHGTRFLFQLSEPAAVKIVIEQPARGRRVGAKCRKPSAKLRRKKACTRYTSKGVVTAAGVQGGNSLAFTGKLRRKALKPGRYRARIVATDAAGNAPSNQPVLSFRIVRG